MEVEAFEVADAERGADAWESLPRAVEIRHYLSLSLQLEPVK